uniref:Uncharacterized protein n=1 Tax=Biomphalaria glabrata TaxID=6526 RepID=A0A2C9KC37_BIOGL
MSSTLLLVGLFCVCRHAALTYANMYSYKSSNNIDHIWAYTQLNYSVYVPTCGWKLILQSGMVITNMTGGDEFFTYTKVDDYTYLLNSKVKYADLSISRPNDQDITLIGPFGTKDPVITVDWFCVCNQSTHGDCQYTSSVYQTMVSMPTPQQASGANQASSTLKLKAFQAEVPGPVCTYYGSKPILILITLVPAYLQGTNNWLPAQRSLNSPHPEGESWIQKSDRQPNKQTILEFYEQHPSDEIGL